MATVMGRVRQALAALAVLLVAGTAVGQGTPATVAQEWPGLTALRPLIRGNQGNTYGYYENAAVAWDIANEPLGRPQVLGITNDNQLAVYADRDSVGRYISNTGPAIMQAVQAQSFTATSVTLASPASTDIRTSMLIDTNDSPKFSARITRISADRRTLTVSGWYRVGNTASGQVPTGTPTLYLNPITKVWPLNLNVSLEADSFADRGAGIELGVRNNRGPLTYGTGNPGSGTNLLWGYDVVCLGTYQCGVGLLSRGNFLRSFVSRGAAQYAYVVEDWAQNPQYGFGSIATTGLPFIAQPGGVTTWSIDTLGGMRLGKQNGALEAAIYFHGSGTTTADTEIHQQTDGNAYWRGHGQPWCLGLAALTALGNDAFRACAVTGQVNQIRAIGAAAGSPVQISAIGADTDVSMLVSAKGAGTVQVGSATNKVAFYGSGGTTKPTITGVVTAGSPLAQLLAALASQGLLTNSTTAN